MAPVLDLVVPSSPPGGSRKHAISSPRSTVDDAPLLHPEHLGLVPIELKNGCSEADCSIESDDPFLTNAVRRHFLEHFGHRDLDAIVKGYCEEAVVISVTNGVRKTYKGHDQIREHFVALFALHPTVDSSFSLRDITIHDKSAMVVWDATTPTRHFPQSCDTLLFHRDGKIIKQFVNCVVSDIEHPWYVDDEN